MPDREQTNKDVIRRLLAEVDRGNLDVVDAFYAPGYVDRTPSPIRSLAPGRDGVRQAFALFQRAFPDTRHTIEDLIAEGDRVVARISARGTHTGELFGHAATGRVVTLTGITIYRLADGETLGLGQHQVRWLDTPHVPHAWECGFLFEERTRTLLCGDLFTQPGAEHAPLTRDDILEPSEAMRGGLDYWAHSKDTRPTLERLAELQPRTLACMHGSAWEGDGASLIRALADRLEARPGS